MRVIRNTVPLVPPLHPVNNEARIKNATELCFSGTRTHLPALDTKQYLPTRSNARATGVSDLDPSQTVKRKKIQFDHS